MTFQQFFNESADLFDLPESPPHGLWIKHNRIIIARGGPFSHDKAAYDYLKSQGIETRQPHEEMYKLGFCHCVVDGSQLTITYIPGRTPRESILKAHAVADFYEKDPFDSIVR